MNLSIKKSLEGPCGHLWWPNLGCWRSCSPVPGRLPRPGLGRLRRACGGSGLPVCGFWWRPGRFQMLCRYLWHLWSMTSAGCCGDVAKAAVAQKRAISGVACFSRLAAGRGECNPVRKLVQRGRPWGRPADHGGSRGRRRGYLAVIGDWPPLVVAFPVGCSVFNVCFFTYPLSADHK